MTFPFSDCARPLGCRRRKNRAACNFPSTETRVAAAAKGLDLCDTRSEIAVPNFHARLTHTHGTVHGCVTPHGLSLALSRWWWHCSLNGNVRSFSVWGWLATRLAGGVLLAGYLRNWRWVRVALWEVSCASLIHLSTAVGSQFKHTE